MCCTVKVGKSLSTDFHANKILLKTIPQKVKSGTKETITVHFIPEYGHVFWDFKDRQISLIE